MTENPTQYTQLANGGACAQLLAKRSLNEVWIYEIFPFTPCVKTVAEKLSFLRGIWPNSSIIDILRDSHREIEIGRLWQDPTG